jgi:S-(hydroxymethyl)glutathione dehydrogenase / alcohol dehydrogenase
MHIKAAVCYAFGQPLVVEEIALDPPQRGEVLVRLGAVGVCHSDVHLIRGDWENRLPVVAGHEGAGVVAEVGAGVAGIQAGDHVVVSLLRSCGHCFYCTHDAPFNCAGTFALATESRLHTQGGDVIYQGIKTGAFAEYVVVDQSQVVPIPADLAFEPAALLACGVITGFGAVVNTAQVPPGSSVAVIGVGGVGVNAIQGAVVSGAHPIIAIDVVEAKLALASAFGATHTIAANTPDIRATIRELSGGRGVDYAIVTVGSTAAMEQAVRIIRPVGTVILVGLPQKAAQLPVRVYPFVLQGQRIIGSFMGSSRLHADVAHLVALYRQGQLKLDELITARYSFDQINTAIETMESGAAVRNVIVFD